MVWLIQTPIETADGTNNGDHLSRDWVSISHHTEEQTLSMYNYIPHVLSVQYMYSLYMYGVYVYTCINSVHVHVYVYTCVT